MNVTGGVLKIFDQFLPIYEFPSKHHVFETIFIQKEVFVEQNNNWERPHFLQEKKL